MMESDCYYHKVREYFVYRDGHGLGSMAIHFGPSLFQFQYAADLKFDCFMCTTDQKNM